MFLDFLIFQLQIIRRVVFNPYTDSLCITCPSRAAVTLGFGDLGCSSQPPDSNLAVGSCGPDNRGTEVNIGFDTRAAEEGVETVTLTVCYDVATSVNIWSRHSLWDEINARLGRGGGATVTSQLTFLCRDHGNDSPSFNPDDYFDYDVNHFYTMVKEASSFLTSRQRYLQ